MQSHLIVMLTHHDRTVGHALDVFGSASDLPVDFWGFKDVGLSEEEMHALAHSLRQAGKKVFLEVVSYTAEECMRGAELAVSLNCDYLMGTLFYPEVWEYLKGTSVVYLPFIGKVSGSPSILEGSTDDMIAEANRYMDLGIKGFDILAFRHVSNPVDVAEACTRAIPGLIVIAGSIASRERMQFVEDIGAWGFTMGSALFENAFVESSDFRRNLEAVVELMNEITCNQVEASNAH